MKLKENSQLEKILTTPYCNEWLLNPELLNVLVRFNCIYFKKFYLYRSHLVPKACIDLTYNIERDLEVTIKQIVNYNKEKIFFF
jgi:hypothetical protein